MNRFFAVMVLALGLCVLMPAASQARVFVGVGIHEGYGGYGGYGGGYYPGYYGPYPYYAPPPVVYAPPAYYAPPVVYPAQPVYQQPVYQQPVYQQPVYQQEVVPSSVMAQQSSETYEDDQGRTCREYQTTAKVAGHAAPAYGTACLQPDGSWRIVR